MEIPYLGHTLTWEKGRQLSSFGSYTYDEETTLYYLQSRYYDAEEYKQAIGGGKFLQSAIAFMLGSFKLLFAVFFIALLGCGRSALFSATGAAVIDFIKCKGQLKAGAFKAFADQVVKTPFKKAREAIIRAATGTKNLFDFLKKLIKKIK